MEWIEVTSNTWCVLKIEIKSTSYFPYVSAVDM